MAEIKIGGRLHSVATDGTVANADEIFDAAEQKKQSEVNAELRNADTIETEAVQYVTEDLNAHKTDSNAHTDIRESIASLEEGLDNTYTKQEVDEAVDNAGKVKSITVNGETQPIDDTGNVAITVETTTEVEIGRTITGEPGTAASVTNTGTAKQPILNFTIPKGQTGERGKKGNDGDTVVYGGADLLLADQLGLNTDKGMTQRAISEAIVNVKAIEWEELSSTKLAHLYINNEGNAIYSSGNYRYVFYAEVNDGDAIKVTASHGVGTDLPNIAVALFEDIPADGSAARTLFEYTNADATEGRLESMYIMPADGFLAISIYGASAKVTILKGDTAADVINRFGNEITAISDMVVGEEYIPTEGGSNEYDYTFNDNHYITKKGAVAEFLNKFKYTTPIKVYKGDIITYTCDGSDTGNNSTLSEVKVENESYAPIHFDKLGYVERKYIVTKDMFIAFSYRYDRYPRLDITINRNGIDNKITELEQKTEDVVNYDTSDGTPIGDDENPLKHIISGPSRVRNFSSYGIIGASFETGYTNKAGDPKAFYDVGYEWPTLMGKVNGVEVRNYAWPGHWLNLWLNGCESMNIQGDNMHNFTDDEPPCECYIINMSSNDVAKGKYTGSVGETTINVETRYDLYDFSEEQPWEIVVAAMIQKVRAKSPKCFIFFATVRKYYKGRSDIDDMILAVKNIANMFDNVFVLDINKYGFDWPNKGVAYGYQTTTDDSHPTRLGHIYLADQFNTYIDWIIGKYALEFRDSVYVNTDYTRV